MEQVNIGRPTKKPWGAYNIIKIKKDGQEKDHWSRVGSAFFNSDGSINVYLDSVPVTGKVQLREQEERRGELGRAADRGEHP